MPGTSLLLCSATILEICGITVLYSTELDLEQLKYAGNDEHKTMHAAEIEYSSIGTLVRLRFQRDWVLWFEAVVVD